jgi:hypothetical protein
MLFPEDSSGQPASSTPFAPAADRSREELASLKRLVIATLAVLAMLAGTFDLYVWKQLSVVRRQQEINQRNVSQQLEEFKRTRVGPMVTFWQGLAAYAQNDPEVRPILQKYSELVPILQKYVATPQAGQPAPK